MPSAVDRVIGEAAELATGQLRARLQRVALELDPEAAEDRLEAGVEDRMIPLRANRDHTAGLLFATASTPKRPCWPPGMSTP